MIEKAIRFATTAHEGQIRKGTGIPYILHPLEAGVIAAGMLCSVGDIDERIVSAAILHDTVEDTGVTLDEIEGEFGRTVAAWVAAQSEDKSKTWKERKQHTLDYLTKETSQAIKIIALSDKLANLRAMSRDYALVGERLWERFNVTDKSQHRWYYSGLADALRDLSSFDAYQEFEALVGKVFAS